MTRLLLTKIPFFREIIVSSFSCEHCGWNNTEIQSAGRIQDQGVRYTLTVRVPEVRGAQSMYLTVLEKAWGLEPELRFRRLDTPKCPGLIFSYMKWCWCGQPIR